MANGLICKSKQFFRKMEPASKKVQQNVYKNMMKLGKNWQEGNGYDNVRDLKYNNLETFKWLYEKYTFKPFDAVEFPINNKDVRKLELGLNYYNQKLAKKEGYFAAKFHVPRQAMKNFPELMKFEKELSNQTSFFRSFTNETAGPVNDILSTFKKYTASFGNGVSKYFINMAGKGEKELAKYQNRYENLLEQITVAKNKGNLNQLSNEIRIVTKKISKFYESGAGEALNSFLSVLEGANPETVTSRDGKPLTSRQKSQLKDMQKNYYKIRNKGASALIRGLLKVEKIAKERNLEWAESTSTKIKGLIKAIEFQNTKDNNGQILDYIDLQPARDFRKLGWSQSEMEVIGVNSQTPVAFSKHYMSHYTLGLLKTIKDFSNDVNERKLNPSEKLNRDLDKWESIVNVAKGRDDISHPVYNANPFFFLKKYISDVGMFNYRTHVTDIFQKTRNKLVNEHLKPAELTGNKKLYESIMSIIKLAEDVERDISIVDLSKEGVLTDVRRGLTALTYFRLMGGNLRSAGRNWTQRLYELYDFGVGATFESRQWYKTGRGTENTDALNRQLNRFGLQWFDGKSVTSNLLNKFRSQNQIDNRTEGAIEQSHVMGRNLYINEKGELTINEGARPTAQIVSGISELSRSTGMLHRIVEDANRSGTFKTAFALAMKNLDATSESFQTRKLLDKLGLTSEIKKAKGEGYQIEYKDLVEKFGTRKAQEKLQNWRETESGQMAYNSVLDLHFEYAKWGKPDIIKATADDNPYIGLAKAGIGQFQHYKFNVFSLLNQWIKEANISYRAGDFRSEQAIKPLRYALLQGTIAAATIAGKVEIGKLASNDVADFSKAMYNYLSFNREYYVDGEVTMETAKALHKSTYGQGGAYFLGPNAGLAMDIFEWIALDKSLASPESLMERGKWMELVEKSINKDDRRMLYDQLAVFNAQAARFGAYTLPLLKSGGGVIDALQLELGLFPSKHTRKWNDKMWGRKKKKRKSAKKDYDYQERRNILSALRRIT